MSDLEKILKLGLFETIRLKIILKHANGTGKSVSEALILESINPQYDDRLFIESQAQNMLCTKIVLNVKTKNNVCTQHVLRLELSCTELRIQ